MAAKHKSRARVRRMTLAARRRVIDRAIDRVTADARRSEFTELANYVTGAGTTMLAEIRGRAMPPVVGEDVLVLFAEDPLRRLVLAIAHYHESTELPLELICSQLAAQVELPTNTELPEAKTPEHLLN